MSTCAYIYKTARTIKQLGSYGISRCKEKRFSVSDNEMTTIAKFAQDIRTARTRHGGEWGNILYRERYARAPRSAVMPRA